MTSIPAMYSTELDGNGALCEVRFMYPVLGEQRFGAPMRIAVDMHMHMKPGGVRISKGRAGFRGVRSPEQGDFVAKRRFSPGIRWHVSPNF